MNAVAPLPHRAAAGCDIAEWPCGWYGVARSRELPRGGVRAVALAGRECVVYRTESGALHALDAHCPHMGAHLRHGSVLGEDLRCALHGYRIDPEGVLRGGPFACPRARAWPIAERHGLVFVHLGPGEPLPLPVPDDADTFAWTDAAPVPIAADWRCMATNAFDMPHLCTIHARELVEPAQAGIDGGRAWLRYVSRVTGRGPSDVLMRWLSRDRIRVRMSCHGPVILAETDLGFTRTAAVLAMLPVDGGLRAHMAFGIRPGPLLRLRLWLTRVLFTAFLRRDVKVVEGMALRMDDRDPGLRVLFAHLRGLRDARA